VLTRFGRFEVQAHIGEGAMADVYRAFDPSINRVVAIKVLKRQFCEDRGYVARFLREARAAGALSHSNIVTVFDVGEEAGHPYIAIELLEGESLDQVLARRGRLTSDEAINIGLQLADALNYAHGLGVVHRDIKPSNVMLSGELVKILDFGIARLVDGDPENQAADASMTHVGQVLGTPRYMSPEQALGRELDGRSDLFSVGVLLYELITGRHAFTGPNQVALALKITQQDPEPLERFAPQTPRGLQFVIGKLLSKRPERRYADGGQLMEALRREKMVSVAVRQEAYSSARKAPLQVRLAMTMAAVTAAALVVSVGTVLQRQQQVLQQMALTSGSAIASFVASNAALSAAENAALPRDQRDWLPVRAFVKAAAADPNILNLTVVDSDGRVQASSRPDDVGDVYVRSRGEREIQGDADLTVTVAQDSGAFRFVRPIRYANQNVGQVEVEVSQVQLKSAQSTSRAMLSSLALVVLGAVVAASYLMARALALPVRRLKRAINDAAAGDFDFRISHSRRDEFGELFNAFNQLNAEVHDRLELAEMERRDRPVIVAGQGPTLVVDAEPLAAAELDRTVIATGR
jgi:eukaryotic-like serine/threonine-protein kinase